MADILIRDVPDAWMIDTSALYRLARSDDAATWANRVERGLVRVATVTLLEVGYSARSAGALGAVLDVPPLSQMPVEHLRPEIEDRAVDVQMALAERGYHRVVSVPDLLVAAMAELNRLTVLHVDRDFELVAEVTGQPIERLVGDWAEG